MGKQKVPSGTTTVSGLWPFPNGYSVWAGTCTLNDPATTGGARPVPVIPEPGQTVTAEVALKPVRLTFLDDDDAPLVDKTVRASIVNTTGCSETEFALGRTDAREPSCRRCPYGQWLATADTVTLTVDVPADGSVTYPLQVPEGVGG